MSGPARGRRAALPPAGFQPHQRLRTEQDRCEVVFVPEDGGPAKTYDFTTLPVSSALRAAFAAALAQRVRPGAGLRAEYSAYKAFWALNSFSAMLASLLRPPTEPADLTPAHLQQWLLARAGRPSSIPDQRVLQATLRKVPGISAAFAARLAQRIPTPPTPPSAPSAATAGSYTRIEFDRILNAARHDVRRATARIRANRDFLARWRAGEIDRDRDVRQWSRGSVLDLVDRQADVPRYTTGRRFRMDWVARLDTVAGHITGLHLGAHDAAAFAVLLVGLTGQNRGTIIDAPAAHHRPDGYAGPIASAIVELDKPRRGLHRHMDVALVDLPDLPAVVDLPAWVAAPAEAQAAEHDDLRTPFGVYTLLHDVAAPARRILGSDRLLVWWSASGGSTGGGLRTGLASTIVKAWACSHDLPADPAPSDPAPSDRDGPEQGALRQLRVTLPLLRLTYLQQRQSPVAHTETTLANEYLLRDRGNLADYQRVVADTLDVEVSKARTRAALCTLTAEDIERARTDPEGVARRHGLDGATLARMLAGELDTVMTACVDNLAGPHTSVGQPCRASFMLCLSCPCARAMPQHLVLQVAVHDAVTDRQAGMTPLRWAQRFALAHTQLADLLQRAGTVAVADARAGITPDQRRLVDRFLHRELDLP